MEVQVMGSRIMLMGFGNVGKGFCSLLSEKNSMLKEYYGTDTKVTGITTRTRGCIYDPSGIDIDLLLEEEANDPQRSLCELPGFSAICVNSPYELVQKGKYDVLAECTVTSLQDKSAGLDYIRGALSRGKSVITTNKGPIAFHYEELLDLANKNNGKILFEGTVMSGTPVFSTSVNGLCGSSIRSFMGVLNGTCNYILERMIEGQDYSSALGEAQKKGYAEADPAMDVEGYDSALKALILANVLIKTSPLNLEDVQIKGINSLSPEVLKEAIKGKGRLRLIARGQLDKNKKSISVGPEIVPEGHPLYSLPGATNGLVLETDTLGTVCLTGAGAGSRETGFALLNDLVTLSRPGYERRVI